MSFRTPPEVKNSVFEYFERIIFVLSLEKNGGEEGKVHNNSKRAPNLVMGALFRYLEFIWNKIPGFLVKNSIKQKINLIVFV